MKYIAYCRKSTDEKNKQVLSIDQQIAELKEFATRDNLEIIDFVVESKTAKVPGREKFAQVLKRIEAGEAQGIVSWHPDRLARNSIDGGKIIYLLDMGRLLDLKFPSFWFESTPQGKFMLNIAFGQSKYYVDNLSENVKRGMKHKVRLGLWPLRAPLGYINDSNTKTIQIHLETSRIVKKAFQLFAEGNKSFKDISLFLSRFNLDRGWESGKDKPLRISRIKNMLTNRFYIGIMCYNGEHHQGSYKLFITKKLFDEAQKQVDRIERPRYKGHNFAFSGLARCGECKAAITCEGKIKRQKNGNVHHYTYYRCTKKLGPCTQKYIQEPDLEIQIRRMLEKVALPQEWAKDWYNWLNRDERKELILAEDNIEGLKAEAENVDKKLNFLLDSFLDQVIDSEIYKKKKNELFEEKLKISEEIEKIKETGSSWLEPMRGFVDRALQSRKIARAKNTKEDLAIFTKTVGSNFFLTDRQLVPTFNLGFAELYFRSLAPDPQTQASGKSEKVVLTAFELKNNEIIEKKFLIVNNFDPFERNEFRDDGVSVFNALQISEKGRIEKAQYNGRIYFGLNKGLGDGYVAYLVENVMNLQINPLRIV